MTDIARNATATAPPTSFTPSTANIGQPVAVVTTSFTTTSSSSIVTVPSGTGAVVSTTVIPTVVPGSNSTTLIDEQLFTANSTVSGKKYSPTTLHFIANATSVGPVPVAFVYTENQPAGPAGVSSGATAGIAIATLLIGALIATAAMFVVQKKKRRRSKPTSRPTYATSGGEHGPVQAVPIPPNEKSLAANNVTDPDYLLPQPKDDQSMASAAKQMFVNIGDHVENFYHNNPLSQHAAPQSEEDELLISRRTRHAAIKRYICREMLSAAGWNCNPSHSLLSTRVVAMAQQMAKGNLNENTYEVAWSRWRVSVALLLQNQDQNQRRQAREYWVDHLQTKLRPFQVNSPEMQTELQKDLYAICDLAENLAILICSQPARWEFDWPRTEGRKDFVIFPAFGRSTDSKARKLDRPTRVLDAHRMQ